MPRRSPKRRLPKPKSRRSRRRRSEPKKTRSRGRRGAKRRDSDDAEDDTQDAQSIETVEAKEDESEADKKPAPKRASRSRKKEEEPAQQADAQESEEAAETTKKHSSRSSSGHRATRQPIAKTPQSVMKAGRAWLEELFSRMNLQISSASRYDKNEKTLHFELEGDDRLQLLGHTGTSGKVIEGIEKVLTHYVALDEKYTVHVDVDQFRQRHTERVREVSLELAKTAVSLSKSITVAGFNDFERRIAHQRLQSQDEIATESQGYGSFRKLRIDPS